MKHNLTTIILLLLLSSCGSESPKSGTAPRPITGATEFIADSISADIVNSRTVGKAELKNLLTDNFNQITRYEVGMRWKETSQSLQKNESSERYCYQLTVTTFEILEILPAGTSTVIQGDALRLEATSTITPIEGDLCVGEIGVKEEFPAYETEMENWAAAQTVDGMTEGYDQLESISIGTFENKTAVKGTAIFEGTRMTFLDFIDQPSIVGSRISYHQETYAGKTFYIASQSILLD